MSSDPSMHRRIAGDEVPGGLVIACTDGLARMWRGELRSLEIVYVDPFERQICEIAERSAQVDGFFTRWDGSHPLYAEGGSLWVFAYRPCAQCIEPAAFVVTLGPGSEEVRCETHAAEFGVGERRPIPE